MDGKEALSSQPATVTVAAPATTTTETPAFPVYNPQDYAPSQQPQQVSAQPASSSEQAKTESSDANLLAPPPPLPPRRSEDSQDDRSPINFTRDPRKLVAYLVPFPKPVLLNTDAEQTPLRFLIYTPPPPPLGKPVEGEKESKVRKVQRKWQEEVRAAKTSQAKTMSWKGVRAGATKGINHLMGKTTGSNIDFLGRISMESKADSHADDGYEEDEATSKTVGLEEMVLLYPSSLPGSPEQIREEFINSMVSTKSKAQRDAIIASGLLPVAVAVDVLATLVWPFGGLAEIDAVWAYGNIRGAKTARNVTKRLTSSGSADQDQAQLQLTLSPHPRLDILERYLLAKCHERDPLRFPWGAIGPTDTDVLDAIGWNPSQAGGETRNWEDEQWEISEVKDDLKSVMGKGAKEWNKWCKEFERDPSKAMKR